MTTKKGTNPANTVSVAIAQARDALAKADAEVARLCEERQAIASAPVPRADAKAAVSERIDSAAADGRRRIGHEAAKFAQGDGSGFDPKELLVNWVWAQESYRPDTDMLVALCARELGQAMHAAIDADPRFDDGNAMPAEQREERVAELDARIADAEARREQLERELADAGFFPEAAESAAPAGGDRGERALIERHNEKAEARNRELERAGVAQRAQPRVIHAFERDERISVGEEG